MIGIEEDDIIFVFVNFWFFIGFGVIRCGGRSIGFRVRFFFGCMVLGIYFILVIFFVRWRWDVYLRVFV